MHPKKFFCRILDLHGNMLTTIPAAPAFFPPDLLVIDLSGNHLSDISAELASHWASRDGMVLGK